MGGLDLARVLANGTNRGLLSALAEGPSHPRALAARLGVSEGQAQRRLRELARCGLVRGAWHHDGKTVKEYALVADGVRFTFASQGLRAEPVGPATDRP